MAICEIDPPQLYSVRISGHACELLLTLFSNSHSPNWAMFLFVQMPFDAAKQSVLGRVPSILLVWDRNKPVCWVHACSCLCDISNFIFEQEQPILNEKPYNITLHIYSWHGIHKFVLSNCKQLHLIKLGQPRGQGYSPWKQPECALFGKVWSE